MMFKRMAYAMTFGGCILGPRFIFAGASVLKEWGIEVTDGPLVICRRLGARYLGLALMFFLGRNAAPSDLRSAVCLGIGLASALLAVSAYTNSFKPALEQRFRTSTKGGVDFARRRHLLVFDRFLARIVSVRGNAATLKQI